MKNATSAIKCVLTALFVAGVLTGETHASVIFSQSGDDVTMVVNETYTLTADQTSPVVIVGFLDVFAPGGGEVFDTSRIGGSVTYSINGGAAVTADWWDGWQYRTGTQLSWTPEDAAILLDLPANTLSAGDSVSFMGSLIMDSTLDSDILIPDTTGAQTVLGGGDGLYSAAHATSVIPEPATLGLLGIFGGGLFAARRMFKT